MISSLSLWAFVLFFEALSVKLPKFGIKSEPAAPKMPEFSSSMGEDLNATFKEAPKDALYSDHPQKAKVNAPQQQRHRMSAAEMTQKPNMMQKTVFVTGALPPGQFDSAEELFLIQPAPNLNAQTSKGKRSGFFPSGHLDETTASDIAAWEKDEYSAVGMMTELKLLNQKAKASTALAQMQETQEKIEDNDDDNEEDGDTWQVGSTHMKKKNSKKRTAKKKRLGIKRAKWEPGSSMPSAANPSAKIPWATIQTKGGIKVMNNANRTHNQSMQAKFAHAPISDGPIRSPVSDAWLQMGDKASLEFWEEKRRLQISNHEVAKAVTELIASGESIGGTLLKSMNSENLQKVLHNLKAELKSRHPGENETAVFNKLLAKHEIRHKRKDKDFAIAVGVVIGIVTLVVIGVTAYLKKAEKSFQKNQFAYKDGMSILDGMSMKCTDIESRSTSTTSTDRNSRKNTERELSRRLARFEQRLAEHTRHLDEEDDDEDYTASLRLKGGQVSPNWMTKH